MGLDDKKYEKFYATDGSDNNKVDTNTLNKAKDLWDLEKAEGCRWYLDHPDFAPLLYQLQQMQDELDKLREEIELNKDKVSQGLTTANTSLSFSVKKDNKKNHSLTIQIKDSTDKTPITKTVEIALK